MAVRFGGFQARNTVRSAAQPDRAARLSFAGGEFVEVLPQWPEGEQSPSDRRLAFAALSRALKKVRVTVLGSIAGAMSRRTIHTSPAFSHTRAIRQRRLVRDWRNAPHMGRKSSHRDGASYTDASRRRACDCARRV